MVKIFCAIVGVQGIAFSVKIDACESVGDLKDVVKAKNPETITCDAKDLQLFLRGRRAGRGGRRQMC
ncbi:hypothetical protein PsorP6_018353 [Peronosclerospora sorghi]|nr:hypothetical protein PsorP6_018357 [Peronosclerospora sorghi]KAI9895934.1 hypothetical protein PsorP6_018353 [Peronosclerospora sorghi]